MCVHLFVRCLYIFSLARIARLHAKGSIFRCCYVYDFELLLCSVIRSFTVAVDDGCFILQNVQECARVKSKNRKKNEGTCKCRVQSVSESDIRRDFRFEIKICQCVDCNYLH